MFQKKKSCSKNRKSFSSKKCAKVRSHIAFQKRATRTHFTRTSRDCLPHALSHAHRTCGSAIFRTCAPQPNICMCVTCKSPDMWTPDICKLHTNCALFVRKLYANCTLLLHVFCISCVFRTLSCTLSLVFKNQRMLMKKNWVTCKTTYHGQKKFKIIYILHTWKLCDFFDNSPVGFAIVDGDGSYLVEQQ